MMADHLTAEHRKDFSRPARAGKRERFRFQALLMAVVVMILTSVLSSDPTAAESAHTPILYPVYAFSDGATSYMVPAGTGVLEVGGVHSGPSNLSVHLVNVTNTGVVVRNETRRLHWPYGSSEGNQLSGIEVAERGSTIYIVATPNNLSSDIWTAKSIDNGRDWSSTTSTFPTTNTDCGGEELIGELGVTPDGRLVTLVECGNDGEAAYTMEQSGTSWLDVGNMMMASGSLCSTDSQVYRVINYAPYAGNTGNTGNTTDYQTVVEASQNGSSWSRIALPAAFSSVSTSSVSCSANGITLWGEDVGPPKAAVELNNGRWLVLDNRYAWLGGETLVKYSNGTLFVSQSQGAVWSRILGPVPPLSQLIVDPDGQIFVLMGLGVLWTSAGSPKAQSPGEVSDSFVSQFEHSGTYDQMLLYPTTQADSYDLSGLTEPKSLVPTSCRSQGNLEYCYVGSGPTSLLVTLRRDPNRVSWGVVDAGEPEG